MSRHISKSLQGPKSYSLGFLDINTPLKFPNNGPDRPLHNQQIVILSAERPEKGPKSNQPSLKGKCSYSCGHLKKPWRPLCSILFVVFLSDYLLDLFVVHSQHTFPACLPVFWKE